jgi:hypothetical protein
MQFKAATRTHYRLPSPAAFAGGGLALIVLALGVLWLAESPEPVRAPVFTPLPRLAAASAARLAAPMPPPVYRHSVIPGGVHGAAELASKLARDPVASIHYANFNVARASLVRLAKARLVHVSYRIGDKIYWTKNKVRLAPGEELLTDGAHLVRTRCGNRIADSRQAMESDKEPAPDVLDALMVSAGDLPDGSGNLANTAAGVTDFTAPAAALLAPAAQAVPPFPAPAMAALVSWNTGLYPSLPASLATAPPNPEQAAPAAAAPVVAAQPGHGDAQVAPAVANAPPTPSRPSTASILASPVTLATAAAPAGSTTGTATPVPEPGSSVLAIVALIALALARRRARRRH